MTIAIRNLNPDEFDRVVGGCPCGDGGCPMDETIEPTIVWTNDGKTYDWSNPIRVLTSPVCMQN